jgi:hypothetical protein
VPSLLATNVMPVSSPKDALAQAASVRSTARTTQHVAPPLAKKPCTAADRCMPGCGGP